LSSHVVEKDPPQFTSQWTGRLLPLRDRPTISEFLDGLARGCRVPWLRPLWAALHPPGSGLIRTLEGHTAGVPGVAVTPDGRHAGSASRDNPLKLWHLDSGREIRMLEGHTDGVDAVVVTPDGRSAVSASWDKTLKLWDLDSGREIRTLEGHTEAVQRR